MKKSKQIGVKRFVSSTKNGCFIALPYKNFQHTFSVRIVPEAEMVKVEKKLAELEEILKPKQEPQHEFKFSEPGSAYEGGGVKAILKARKR